MDIYMLILRLLHVVSGIVWVGAVFTMVGFIMPAVKAAGPDGGKFMQALGSATKLAPTMMTVAPITILAGLLLYVRDSGGLSLEWIATSSGLVLTLGALTSIVGFGFGLQLSRLQKQMGVVGKAMAAAGGKPGPEQLAELQGLQVRMATLQKTVAILLAIAVVSMAIFRYV